VATLAGAGLGVLAGTVHGRTPLLKPVRNVPQLREEAATAPIARTEPE